MTLDYTTVLGVDLPHLRHLELVFPNWVERKPRTILDRPLVVFYDTQTFAPDGSDLVRVCAAVKPHKNVTIVPWPYSDGTVYENDPSSRFGKSQRYKMLAGFVHVPSDVVKTPYWLKLDLDVVATDVVSPDDDNWIMPHWFRDEPAIIASAWGYTKPPDQMLKLDEWVWNNREDLPGIAHEDPLNLRPSPGSSMVKHKRIISWCGFFHTGFTRFCSTMAHRTCGLGKLPVPSQDGFMWYCAARCRMYYVTAKMKALGWEHCAGYSQARAKIDSLMADSLKA